METTILVGDQSGLALPLGRGASRAPEEAGGRLREHPNGAFAGRQRRLLRLLKHSPATSALWAPVGMGPSGPLWITLDRASGVHCVVVEDPGPARADLLRTVALGLALTSRPTLLQMVAIDLSGRELHPLETLPHASGETASDPMAARMLLRWVAAECQSRMIEGRAWPRILLVIDDLGLVMDVGPRRVSETIQCLFRRGAALGIHLLAGVAPAGSGQLPSGSPIVRLDAGATKGFYRCRELSGDREFQAATVPVGDLDWVGRGRFWERPMRSNEDGGPSAARGEARRRTR